MVYEHLVLYRKHSKCKYAPVPPFFQIEEAWIRWSIWNPSPSVGLRNCLEAFLHTSFSPHLLPLPHPQIVSGIPSYCSQVCLADLRGRLFFFPLPHCASSLAFLFPLGRGCFLSWTCSKKGVRLAVPVRCCPWSLYKGSCTKQGWQAVTHRDPHSRVEKLVPGMLFLLRNLKTEERSVTHWKCVLSVTFAVCFFFSPL